MNGVYFANIEYRWMQVCLGNGIHGGEKGRDGLRSVWALGALLEGAKQTCVCICMHPSVHSAVTALSSVSVKVLLFYVFICLYL